jgi:hypothetical protein
MNVWEKKRYLFDVCRVLSKRKKKESNERKLFCCLELNNDEIARFNNEILNRENYGLWIKFSYCTIDY